LFPRMHGLVGKPMEAEFYPVPPWQSISIEKIITKKDFFAI